MTRSRMALSFGERLDLDLMVGEEPAAAHGGDGGAPGHPSDPRRDGPHRGHARDAGAGARRAGLAAPAPAGVGGGGRAAGGSPLLLQAIVYDFDRSPPAREIHVFEALIAAFEEARTRGIRSVAVQPLGTSHAGLDPERFLKLLAQVCYSSAELSTTVRRVHLLLPLAAGARPLRGAAAGPGRQARARLDRKA